MKESFIAKKISDNVFWVGAIDKELREFHGYSTSRGTTYNAFLILGEKPVLIDTVKPSFFSEMMERIKSVIDPKKIRYIISNHAELDHSGSMLSAVNEINPEKIFATILGAQALEEHFNCNLNIERIKDGEEVTLGDITLKFLETKMLHWPDSMFTYFTKDKILFTQDCFGMHFATDKLFAKENKRETIHYESMKYFANILTPFSDFVKKTLSSLNHLNLDIQILAPDHGPLWNTHRDIEWIMNLWDKWSQQTPSKKAIITYDTMWESTAKMAEAIASGIDKRNVSVKIIPISNSNRSDIATELLESGALIIGSPTLNRQIFPTIADLTCYLKGLRPKNKFGQVFGSYGWSGDSIKILEQEMTNMNIELFGKPIKTKYVPNKDCLKECVTLGQNISEKLKNLY